MAKLKNEVNDLLGELASFHKRAQKKFLLDNEIDDEQFLQQAGQLHVMTDSPAWKILETYWFYQREMLWDQIENAKDLDNWNFYRGASAGYKLAARLVQAILLDAIKKQKQQDDEAKILDAESE